MDPTRPERHRPRDVRRKLGGGLFAGARHSGHPHRSAAIGKPDSGCEPDPVPSTVGQPTPTPTPAPPGQTTTDWGRIWDGVPASFPRRPGSEPTETAAGPASAVLSVPAGVAEAANWYVTALGSAGYHVAGASGPFEDGSFVVDATGRQAACHVQVTVAKVGTLTVATIMYGASCPFR